MSAQLSEQAQVAKLIRQYCKSIGVKCTARSSSFSMGDSVDWTVYDVNPETYKQISDYADQFKQGHFDGMNDIYEYSNTDRSIPQTKYCMGHNEFSDELKQKAWEFLKAKCPANCGHIPADFNEAKHFSFFEESEPVVYGQDSVYNQVRSLLMGTSFGLDQEYSAEFWKTLEPAAKATLSAVKLSSGATIEKHTHTKHGFDFWIVVLADRVERAEYDALLSACKAARGWYSRKWGTSPAGFAFKEESAALAFAKGLTTGTDAEPDKLDPVKPVLVDLSAKAAAHLRGIAEKMEGAIVDKFRDRETNTPKRLAQAMSARLDGERLKRTQAGLLALADLHEAGTVPTLLAGVTSKAAAYTLAAGKHEQVPNGYHAYSIDTGKPALDSKEARAFWALLSEKTEAEKTADKIAQLVRDLQFSQIPGYFPTPDDVIQLMIDEAEIKETDLVFDPEGGHGAICDLVKPLCKVVNAVEKNCSLAEILSLKGYLVANLDFLMMEPDQLPKYDKILMNPPFENLQDINHAMHAFKFLKPAGRLVAIMSESAFFNSNKKAEKFRTWLADNNGYTIELPAGAFKASGTMVKTRIVVLDKGE